MRLTGRRKGSARVGEDRIGFPPGPASVDYCACELNPLNSSEHLRLVTNNSRREGPKKANAELHALSGPTKRSAAHTNAPKRAALEGWTNGKQK